jgi:hypothetical protein
MDNDVGGNWYHGVYETVHIISSRRTTEYKDVPMPADWPDFPSAEQVLTYVAVSWSLEMLRLIIKRTRSRTTGTCARTPSAIRSESIASLTPKVRMPSC